MAFAISGKSALTTDFQESSRPNTDYINLLVQSQQ